MPESDASAEAMCCFVIAPIGGTGTEIRRRSDQVLEYIIRPVVSEFGYRALRADEMPAPGLITSQVIQEVIESPLVIADLTDHNPNVFYELALRHAFRKPVIQLIQADQAPPFDVVGLRTIFVDHRDLESVDACRRELRKQIRDVQSGGEAAESPISVAVDLEQLRRSENPVEKSAGEILESLADLRRMVRGLTHEVRKLYGESTMAEAAEAVLEKLTKEAAAAYVRQASAQPEPSIPRPTSTPPSPWVPSSSSYDDEEPF